MTEETARTSRVPATLRALRPKQWLKNVLVFAAPLAAGPPFTGHIVRGTLFALTAFILVSSSIYLINDVRDAEADRLHPQKRLRPVASGELKPGIAIGLAAFLGAAGLVVAAIGHPMLLVTLAVYAVLQVGYVLGWKHVPLIDIAIVAMGFLLRAVAGGVASDIPLSQWFLLVAGFGSLFMVSGKRYSEIVELGSGAGTRRSLTMYTASYLRSIWTICAAVVIVAYGLWAFDLRANRPFGIAWTAISIAPFTLAILRYAMRIDAGEAGAPEEVVIHDRMLQAVGLFWVLTLSVALFLH